MWFFGAEAAEFQPSPISTAYGGFPCGSAGKEPACNAGDLGSIPGLGRTLGERNGYPLQYSDPENSMDCIESQKAGHNWATFTDDWWKIKGYRERVLVRQDITELLKQSQQLPTQWWVVYEDQNTDFLKNFC